MPKTKRSSGTQAPTPSRPQQSDSLLTLDLSSKSTGWAFFVGPALIDHGHFSPHRPHQGEAAYALIDEISRILKIYAGVKVDGIGYEHAFRQPGKAAESFAVLETALKMVAFKHQLPLYRANATSIKKAATGSGRAEKRDVIEAVERRFKIGLDPARETPDGDIADAIGVWMVLTKN